MSAPCRVCGRPLDDCGTCVCATRPAPALKVQDVTLFLGGSLAPLRCTGCGREYTFTKDVTTLEHCYFCHRHDGRTA